MSASAGQLTATIVAPPMASNTMIHWLARAAKELREEGRRLPVHIAASIDKNQTVIYNFERGEAWPRTSPDLVIAAYADDLDIDDGRAIWERALSLWREHGEAPLLDELKAGNPSAAEQVSAAVRDAAQAPGESPQRRSRRRGATG